MDISFGLTSPKLKISHNLASVLLIRKIPFLFTVSLPSLPHRFISVRCCGLTLTTPIAPETQKPTFSTKLQFPVFLPLLNDKIVIRIWDQRKGLPDIYIASIPEIPSDSDHFNINSLLSKGGVMPYRWINLYGIPKDDRTSEIVKMFGAKKKVFEGTEYMGKVLMSLNLSPNEKPDKGRFPLNSYREPPSMEYTLFADVYELQGGIDCGENVWIKVSIGPNFIISAKADQTMDKDQLVKGSYIWKTSKIMLDEKKAQFPTDQTQIPDIFVSLYTKTFWGEKRVAYLRLPISDPSLANNDPKWYPLKSVENNIDDKKVGFLLLNLHFTSSKKKGSRVPKRRNIKAKFYFIIYIHAGYDLAPNSPPDALFPAAEINIAAETFTPTKNANQKGKNPVWEEFMHREIELTENLEFASNITVTIKNNAKGLLAKGQELFSKNIIGEFSIPAMECNIYKKRSEFTKLEPKLYILYKDGLPQGRLLASFNIIKATKKLGDIDAALNDMKSHKVPCNLEFAVVGIRNLVPAFKNPTIHMSVAGVNVQAPPLRSSSELDSDQPNPNFLDVIQIPNVDLPEDPLYLPPIELEIKNNGLMGGSLYCSLQGWEYAEWAVSSRIAEVANIFNAAMVQTTSKAEEKKKEVNKKDKNKENRETMNKDVLKAVGAVAIDIPGGDLKNVISPEYKKGKGEMEILLKKNDQWDLENLQEELNDVRVQTAEANIDSDDDLMARTTMASDSNFRMDIIEELDCTKRDKDREKKEKKGQITKLFDQIKELKKVNC